MLRMWLDSALLPLGLAWPQPARAMLGPPVFPPAQGSVGGDPWGTRLDPSLFLNAQVSVGVRSVCHPLRLEWQLRPSLEKKDIALVTYALVTSKLKPGTFCLRSKFSTPLELWFSFGLHKLRWSFSRYGEWSRRNRSVAHSLRWCFEDLTLAWQVFYPPTLLK